MADLSPSQSAEDYLERRQKLDVVNKTRSNTFDWRGQFTPEFVMLTLH